MDFKKDDYLKKYSKTIQINEVTFVFTFEVNRHCALLFWSTKQRHSHPVGLVVSLLNQVTEVSDAYVLISKNNK